MNIVLTSDNNYINYLAVTLCSICENNNGERLQFHIILNLDVEERKKQFLVDLCKRYGQSIVFYTVDIEKLCDSPVWQDNQLSYITRSAYIRLFLPSILPKEIEKVIYLDCDLIVLESLRTFWNTDITGFPVAAVTDMDAASLDRYRRLRYPVKYGYFNSGVLLINLKYWREHSCQRQFEEFIKNNSVRIVYHDQDVLNFVFQNNKIELPIKFNLQEAGLYTRVNLSWEYDEQLEEAIKNPIIVHYTTGRKPWNVGCTHPWRGLWYQYLSKTGIADFKPIKKKEPRRAFKSIVRQLMVRLGLLNPIYEYRKGIRRI